MKFTYSTLNYTTVNYSTKQLQMNDQLIYLFIVLDITKLQTTSRKGNDQLICHKNPLADHEKGRTTEIEPNGTNCLIRKSWLDDTIITRQAMLRLL